MGERVGAVGGLLEHGGEVEARAQAQHRRAQGGDALAQDLDLAGELVAALQSTLPVRGRSARSPGGRSGCGVGGAADISENLTIFVTMHTLYSHALYPSCAIRDMDGFACPSHTLDSEAPGDDSHEVGGNGNATCSNVRSPSTRRTVAKRR